MQRFAKFFKPLQINYQCRSGGIGRHDGFKIRCFCERAGSSPASGTILCKKNGMIINRPKVGFFVPEIYAIFPICMWLICLHVSA